MTTRLGHIAILALFALTGLFGTGEAKRRPSAAADTAIAPVPPAEILHLTSHECTIPRQSLYTLSDEDRRLAGEMPAEVWYKFQYDGKGGKRFELVYSSVSDTTLAQRCDDIAVRLILRTPSDSNKTQAWYYHRIVLLANGDNMKLDRNAIPVPGDLPKPITTRDPNYTFPDIIKRGDLEIPDGVGKPGQDVSVLLRYRIGVDGKVEYVEVQKSSGNLTLDRAAVAAAYHTKCKPATRNGKPEVAWVSDRIIFGASTPDRLKSGSGSDYEGNE